MSLYMHLELTESYYGDFYFFFFYIRLQNLMQWQISPMRVMVQHFHTMGQGRENCMCT